MDLYVNAGTLYSTEIRHENVISFFRLLHPSHLSLNCTFIESWFYDVRVGYPSTFSLTDMQLQSAIAREANFIMFDIVF